jgi:hypothetical protein
MLIRSPSGAFAVGISASPLHQSRPKPRGPQGRLTRPVHRPSDAEVHPAVAPCGGTLPLASDQPGQVPRASCFAHPFGWCARGARLPSACGRLACLM